MAALLLKKKYLDIKDNMSKIPGDKLDYIVMKVHECMTVEKPLLFLKRCCEILVKIYTLGGLKEQLVNEIRGLSVINSINMKLTLMYFIEIVCEFAFDDNLLIQHSVEMVNIFSNGLKDDNNDVRVSAFKTTTIFLSSITSPVLVNEFTIILEVLLDKAIELIQFDQESGVVALESLNELIEAHPKFIKPMLPKMLRMLT
ncbi:unnamed protein product [Sphagnum balticum]